MPNPGKPLTPADRVFLAEVLSNGGSIVEAFRVAFPNWHGAEADRSKAASDYARRGNLRKAIAEARGVQRSAIDRVIDQYAITQDRLADRLACFAFTDLDQIVEWVPVVNEEGVRVGTQLYIKQLDQIPAAARAAINKMGQTDKGRITVEMPDRRACLMDIARLKGWIQDRPIETKQMVMLKIER